MRYLFTIVFILRLMMFSAFLRLNGFRSSILRPKFFKYFQVLQVAPKSVTSQKTPSKKSSGKTLVIVESPAKAKTIQKFLNEFSNDYIIDYSAGHIRTLASQKEDYPEDFVPTKICPQLGINTVSLGVDVPNNFTPHYAVIKGKEKIISRLKSELKGVDQVLLATDEDREGEAISWHLVDALNLKIPYKVNSYSVCFYAFLVRYLYLSLESCIS
jgi:reverse gyrase